MKSVVKVVGGRHKTGHYTKTKLKTIIIMSENSKKETWKMIINLVITILTAVATTFGITSCM